MNRINKEIKAQYSYFTELLSVNKIVISSIIQLGPKRNNDKWRIGESSIQHEASGDKIILIVEQSRRDSKYGLKLRCPNLSAEPFFRFDSDGPAHRNNFSDIPLEKQSVTTPHFNSYNSDGNPIAYKNETLKNEKESHAIVSDINFGVSLFCMETNTQLLDGEFPMILDKEPEIEFDLVRNINFDNIKFE